MGDDERDVVEARTKQADDFDCDVSTVKRAIRAVQNARKRAQERLETNDTNRQASAQIVERRRAALAKLREMPKSSMT